MSDSDNIIEIENLSKQYRLGQVSTGTVAHDLNRWWARMRGKEDPTLQVTHSNDRTHDAESAHEFVWALEDINFEVKRGEVLGIIGRNGAGKSTLLKILSRVTAPTSGEIRVDGSLASLLEVGTGFHPELTGRENIFLNGAILGMSKNEIRSKLDEIVDFSGCARYLDTPAKRYSSGMIVRLGFAVAAHLEPDILIVDEVLAVGDAEFQKTCIGKMKDVASHGRTVLFVSHNMGMIESLCARSITLRQGCVEDDGETKQVIQRYVQMNESEFFTGSVIDVARKTSNGKIWIEEVVAENCDGAVGIASIGEMLNFVFSVRVWENLSAPRLAVGVDDQMGRRLFTLATDLDPNFKFTLNTGERMRIRCTLPEVILMPGRYHLTVALLTRGELVDGLERVCPFDIVGRDFFGTGRELHVNQGVVVCRSNWSMMD